MQVLNVHERVLPVGAAAVGALMDTVASDDDALWPKASWPRVCFDRPLGVGAVGGHGPIPYVIEEFRPGQLLKCRFLGPRGFHGGHWLEVIQGGDKRVILRHTIGMRAQGIGMLTWLLVVRPLHDALMEDAMALAQARLGLEPDVRPWSRWVKCLRWVMSRGRARAQQTPIRRGQ